MERREFLAFLGVTTLAWSAGVRAQQKKLPRVGVLWHAGSADEESVYLAAFLEGLRDVRSIQAGKKVDCCIVLARSTLINDPLPPAKTLAGYL